MKNNETYFFDKRKRKRAFIKYGSIFLIALVPMILFNVFANKFIDSNIVVVFLDCVILLVFVAFGHFAFEKIFEKQDKKLEAKIKRREAAELIKDSILEDSYRAIREKKLQEKENKKKQSEKGQSETETKKESSEQISAEKEITKTENKKENTITDVAQKKSTSSKNVASNKKKSTSIKTKNIADKNKSNKKNLRSLDKSNTMEIQENSDTTQITAKNSERSKK